MQLTEFQSLIQNLQDLMSNSNDGAVEKLTKKVASSLHSLSQIAELNWHEYIAILDIDDNPLLNNVSKEISDRVANLQQYTHELNVNSAAYTDQVSDILDLSESIQQALSILRYLILFSHEKKDIVICGANGVGKSSFVSKLKDTYLKNLVVIPAEKYLYYYSNKDQLRTTKDDFNNIQQQDPRRLLNDRQYDGELYKLSQNILNRFSVVLMYFVNQYVEELNKEHVQGEIVTTVFDEVRELFVNIFPEVELSVDTSSREIRACAHHSQKTYGVDSMSDGEKVSLYYLVSIILAPENSYIVVDEPETYMNAVIFNKLWDLLKKRRKDCQFIFVSHSKEFIESRTNDSILWIKGFEYPDKWDISQIPTKSGLTNDVIMALVGTRKPLLICEGNDNSFDQQVFSQIFINDFSIVPVSGHRQVISSVKAVNQLNLNQSRRAVGIVDGDGLDLASEQAENLKKNKIYVLPFNEIEMMLITEPIMKAVLHPFLTSEQIDEKIRQFKSAFFKLLDNEGNMNRMITNTLTNRINYELGGSFVNRAKDINGISTEWEDTKKKIDAIIEPERLKETFHQLINDRNYDSLLKYCNLKHEVVPALTNKYIESEYTTKAIGALRNDSELCESIKEEFFAEVK